MRRKQSANPINLKGVDVIVANEIASAFIRFKKAWYDHYAWEEGWYERWVAFEAWNPKAVSKLEPEFKELVSNYLYGLSGKTIGDFLRNKNIEFSKDWKVNSIFNSTKIILASYKNFKDGHYFSPNDGKPYIFINPWLIWEGLPRSNSETSFKKLLKNFLGHELIHALDWAYRYKKKEEDTIFDPDKSEQEEAYYNSPHELKAYVYTVADLIWNQTLPMYRAIQSWNGEALYRYVFSDMTGIGDKIKPKNRRAFIQRVVKQLEMFKQEWVKEQGSKKAGYSEIDEEFLEKEGIDPDDIGWLGGGENGNAYDLGDGRVLKITRSNNEYQKALEVKGKRFSNLIDIYSAEKVGSAYYIIMEDLDMDPQDEALFYETLEILNTQGLPITYISYFDQEEYEAEYGEISEEVKAFINELETVVSDLRRAGIGDRADIHADNLGRDKNTGALKAFDLMEKD